MKTLGIASMVIGGILAVAPAALGGGFGDVRFPSDRLTNGRELKDAQSGAAANFYARSDQSQARHWHIRLDWKGYPFGFAIVSE